MEPHKKANLAGVAILDEDHRRSFERALIRILQTDLAEKTYAEILDGMPTSESYRDMNFYYKGHPAMDHTELCSGALDKAREFRSNFNTTTLQLPLPALLAFQEAQIDSKPFHLRLLELLAASCHQIAVYLFQVTEYNHHHAEHEAWRDEPPESHPADPYRAPTAFSHGPYIALDQYPNGMADVAGYWAEARIFGGIFVFDRGETENECRDIYVHACRGDSPRTIFPPTKDQLDRLIWFLLAHSEFGNNTSALLASQPVCPLPILPTLQNHWRWDPWDAFARFHIFRDRHERRVSKAKPRRGKNRRAIDWPEIGDQLFLLTAAYDRQEGKPVDEDLVAAAREGMKMITASSPLWRDPRAEPPVHYIHLRNPDTGEITVVDNSQLPSLGTADPLPVVGEGGGGGTAGLLG